MKTRQPKLKKDGTEKRSGGAGRGQGKKKINPLDKLKTVSFSVAEKYLLHFGGKDVFIAFMKMYAEKSFNEKHDIKTITESDIIQKAIL